MTKTMNTHIWGCTMDKETEKVLSTLSYPIPILGLILALVAKSKEGKFHGWQGFFWGIALFVVNIILGWIWMLYYIVFLAWLVLSIIFAVKTWKGEMFEIPVIASIVKAINK